MNAGYVCIAVIFAAALIYFLAKKFHWMKKTEDSNPAVQKERMEDELEKLDNETSEESFEKDFFRRCEEGEKSVLFMKIAGMQDCSILRSLLYSAGIPSYVESEHSSGMYGNAADVNVNLIAMQLYVLEEDREDALVIAEDYIKSKSPDGNNEAFGLKIY